MHRGCIYWPISVFGILDEMLIVPSDLHSDGLKSGPRMRSFKNRKSGWTPLRIITENIIRTEIKKGETSGSQVMQEKPLKGTISNAHKTQWEQFQGKQVRKQ